MCQTRGGASEVGLVLAPQGLGGQAPATAGLLRRSELASWQQHGFNYIRGKTCEQGFRITQGRPGTNSLRYTSKAFPIAQVHWLVLPLPLLPLVEESLRVVGGKSKTTGVKRKPAAAGL